MKQDMIVILDLGSEENPRLAREIRALGVYSEIYPHDITLAELNALPNVKGIILNGGPNHVVDGVETVSYTHLCVEARVRANEAVVQRSKGAETGGGQVAAAFQPALPQGVQPRPADLF